VLMFLVSVSITSTFQSCFSYYQTPFDKPVLFGIAKVEIFLVVAKFFKTFFSFLFSAGFKRLKEITISTRNHSNHPSLYPFHCFPSSEAGCKSRKII
ncbi:hypothetical protein ABDJ41_20840, partial [Pedobacter sp. ASV1-7]|uniref:hypothetical protein n=1 Tax=Pedobacter sp. ASV1-7 TaxID=3145237 RepID=UPI0032E8C648